MVKVKVKVNSEWSWPLFCVRIKVIIVKTITVMIPNKLYDNVCCGKETSSLESTNNYNLSHAILLPELLDTLNICITSFLSNSNENM